MRAPFCYDPATNANVRTVVVDSIGPVVAIISFESNDPAPHFCSMKITQEVREYAAQKELDEQAALERCGVIRFVEHHSHPLDQPGIQ